MTSSGAPARKHGAHQRGLILLTTLRCAFGCWMGAQTYRAGAFFPLSSSGRTAIFGVAYCGSNPHGGTNLEPRPLTGCAGVFHYKHAHAAHIARVLRMRRPMQIIAPTIQSVTAAMIADRFAARWIAPRAPRYFHMKILRRACRTYVALGIPMHPAQRRTRLSIPHMQARPFVIHGVNNAPQRECGV